MGDDDTHMDGSMQSYHNDYNSYGPHDRRTSSSASHFQYPGPQGHLYGTQDGSQQLTGQYQYNQLDGWPMPGLQTLPNVSQSGILNIEELQQLSNTNAVNAEPWNPARPLRLPRCQPNVQAGSYRNNVPKAYTVAAHPIADSAFQRPDFGNRDSWLSIPDSGFVSHEALQEELEPTTPNHSEFRASPHINLSSPPALPEIARSEPGGVKRGRGKAQLEPCDVCGRLPKNSSDASKHALQHEKPFRCLEYRCTRKEGFATNNDLQRHRKSVHGVEPEVGRKTGYICQACPPPANANRLKWWPRLDNFKAHIGRKHKSWNAQQLIELSEHRRPTDAVSESGYGSQPADESCPDLSSPLSPAMSRQQSRQGNLGTIFEFNQGRTDTLAGVGTGQLFDLPTPSKQSGSAFQGQSITGNGFSLLHSREHQGSPVDRMISPMDTRYPVPELHLNGRMCDTQQQYFSRTHLEERSPKKRRVTGTMMADLKPEVGPTEGQHTCNVCGKVKNRECDLRKHMKRHDRPYGCTFPSCIKRFGSRNDWKRHENSQHYQEEMWRCQFGRDDGSGKCGRLAYRKDTFALHLFRKHSVPLQTHQSEVECTRSHLGREGHHQFWCGFCDALIQQPESILQGAWDFRLKHIGDHFDKNNSHISNWIDIEENRPKGQLSDHDRKRSKAHRPRNGKGGFTDDDSGLGEDGIPQAHGYNTEPVYQQQVSTADYQTGMPLQRRGHAMSNEEIGGVGEADDADGVSDEEWPGM
ncbi:hypothetical protein LTR37_002671 [Vermiconidia calcicola]|uniref:Uncharacterized protein n=1 Tax=Vermiconidia calcicola TaxID=1690605 RepID=A0ACC3NSP9_9PEZI|nr:hypothetical protein LTR37_002671 [Vermiconidia calcicola]